MWMEIGHLIKAGNKDLVKHVSASLLLTQKDVIVLMDYDDKKVEELLQNLSNTFKSKNYEIQISQGNTLKIRGGSTIILIPMGLPDDETFKEVGITWHEMEDYCLKLIEIDEKPKEWAGISVKELVKRAEVADIKGANKSSTALQLLAAIKGMSCEDAITEIIKSTSQKILKEIMPQALKEIIS